MNPDATNLKYDPTPDNINQFCTQHLGIVTGLADPEKRGRVRIEVPGLNFTGKQNRTPWIDVAGTRVGNGANDGDVGDGVEGTEVLQVDALVDVEDRGLFDAGVLAVDAADQLVGLAGELLVLLD